uniref:ABC transporter domain-containing protein n=1 Tax=Vitis vinifera TaxID=29760 RepID=F6HCS3_VITVI
MAYTKGHRRDAVMVSIGKPVSLTGGLEFSNLTYTVKKKEKIEGKWVSQEVDLLHMISGYAPKGSITGVMGPSGAGKSTLLDGLAGRISSGSLKGGVSLDGMEISPSLIKRTSAYIMQEDLLFPMLTVYETLMFAADFRLGPLSWMDKKLRVEKLIEQLGLTGENPVEYLIDVIQEYNQSEHGVEVLATFVRTGLKPPPLSEEEVSMSTVPPTPTPSHHHASPLVEGRRLPLQAGSQRSATDFDHSLRSPYNSSRSWSASHSGIVQTLSASPGYTRSNDILEGTPTPHSSDYTVNESDYLTPNIAPKAAAYQHLGPKFANSFLDEIWILMRRNFINIRRTPELFLSRLLVLTVMGFMMATMFTRPKADIQGNYKSPQLLHLHCLSLLFLFQ